MTRILMVGGGSAGHVAPMVAVTEALETLEPGIAIAFVCSDKPSDAAFLRMEGRSCATLPLPRRSVTLPMTFARAFAGAMRILRAERPDVVFSKGSAVSVPLVLAARLRGIPVVAHESDAVMGWANRAAALLGATIVRGTEIGNPVRARVTHGQKEEGLRIAGFDGRKPVLLVMGGSQGALAINQAIGASLDSLLEGTDVIHLTGKGKAVAANRPGYYATEFGSDVLPHLYAATDLAVSRAGAGSIAELAACGIPAILVPIKGLAGDHQVKNAERAEKTGAFIHLPQDRIAELPSLVADLLSERKALETLRDKNRYAARPEAARLIAETVLRSVARKNIDA